MRWKLTDQNSTTVELFPQQGIQKPRQHVSRYLNSTKSLLLFVLYSESLPSNADTFQHASGSTSKSRPWPMEHNLIDINVLQILFYKFKDYLSPDSRRTGELILQSTDK